MKLTLRDLAKITVDQVAELVKSGEVKGPSMWAGMKGAGAYLKAVAKGDIATDSDQAGRADICRGCKHATPRLVFVRGKPVTTFYCGTPAWYADEWDNSAGTCGCLVGISVDGEPLQHAAGKAVVESERCPLGKW